jgi:recombination protein RecA
MRRANNRAAKMARENTTSTRMRSFLLLQVLISVPQATTSFAFVPASSVAAARKFCRRDFSLAAGGETEEGTDSTKARKLGNSSSSKKQQQREDNSNSKRAALDVVLSNIERSYGRGSILQLGDADSMNVETISSGALTLDVALGGGYPKGRVVEIYGPESSGKTTLALHAIASVHARGGTAAFIDAEHALDPQYAANLGVCVDQLYVSQPDCGEMALDIVDQLVRSSAVDLIVVDSVAALVPRAELEGDMSDTQIGLQARLMSKALRKITGSLARSSCTVIFLNQLRSKVGVIFGSPEVTSGGNALKFYASVRLDTRRKEVLTDNMGIKVKVKVVKNKVAVPFQSAMFDILFKNGIDTYGCLLDAATDLDVVERRGSYYSYDGKNFAQGRSNAVEYMKENNAFLKKIEAVVRQKLLSDDKLVTGNIGKNDPVDDILPLSEGVEYSSGIGVLE